jgi:lipoate-protein ligase A
MRSSGPGIAQQAGLLFSALEVYDDRAPRAAALNMAIDEALLEIATAPSIRFYRWDQPALSFGYFGKFADVETHASERDIVRRWTGGGIVFHGDDLTYSIVIPANDSVFAESSMSIYESVHQALCAAIVATGQHAVVAVVADRGAGVSDAGYNEHCFANPVQADVLVDGHKIAGAAQRRTRRGLLQQGSIQHVDLGEDFAQRFACELSANCNRCTIGDDLLKRAREIISQKYATEKWLHKR